MRNLFKVSLLIGIVLILGAAPLPAATADNLYLETIGGFIGPYIYTTYGYIAVTADAYTKKLYPAERVRIMMDESVNMLRVLIDSLKKVQATNLHDADKEYLDQTIQVLNDLKTVADSLSAFVASGNKADAERYEETRKKVWPMIKEHLRIK